jgi:hypothetical protein
MFGGLLAFLTNIWLTLRSAVVDSSAEPTRLAVV